MKYIGSLMSDAIGFRTQLWKFLT